MVRVHGPGLLTTVQDLGRPGWGRFGVTGGGALDRAALILGNRLVGNEPGAAALEVTLVGPRLAFEAPTVVAVTGADLGARVEGQMAPRWSPFLVPAGGELVFAPGGPVGRGARAYVCVAGGFDLPPVMGSRSTDLTGAFGGLEGRALRTGDRLPVGTSDRPVEDLLRLELADGAPTYQSPATARVVLGPQQDRFTDAGVAAFLGGPYSVTSRADRMGVRLIGPPVAHSRGADLRSEGIAHGAVQVPGNGQPIVLLAGRQTVGGYPKVATVIGADLDRLAQLRPGDTVAFEAVDVAVARALTLEAHARLGERAVAPRRGAVAGWSVPVWNDEETRMPEAANPTITAGATAQPTPHAPGIGATRGEAEGGAGPAAWSPEGVVRVIEAARAAGVTRLRLAVASAGLDLELALGATVTGGEPTATERQPATAAPPAAPALGAPVAAVSEVADGAADGDGGGDGDGDRDVVIHAPVLGAFYRRAAPDQPLLAEVGGRVDAGQVVGVVEVMKTYHDVVAPRAGIVSAFLAEDGQFVEYGQPVARLAPGGKGGP